MKALTHLERRMLAVIDDHDAFVRLKIRGRERVTARLPWAILITESEHGNRETLKAEAAKALNVSLPTVGRFVRAFKESGWQALADNRGVGFEGVPAEFVEFVKALHLQCQRETSGKEVQRILLERLSVWRKSGHPKHAIPGYRSPPPDGLRGYKQRQEAAALEWEA